MYYTKKMTYSKRDECVICKSRSLTTMFEKDYTFPIGNFAVDSPEKTFHFIPYNILTCEYCKTTQTKYLGDLNLIYENNFAGAYGTIRNTLNEKFAEFILENQGINGILEVGAGNGSLSQSILDRKSVDYTIVDPSYAGPTENRNVKACYFEDYNDSDKYVNPNTIVMSQVFEHFYNPCGILEKIQLYHQTVDYIYVSWPNLEAFIKNGVYHVLNPEHTFYVENDFLVDLFKFYSFTLEKTYYHMDHSVFFAFKRDNNLGLMPSPKNKTAAEDTKSFFEKALANINVANKAIDSDKLVYIWPCSMHTLFCMSLGLKKQDINNVLDNSPLKINKYLYGYKHKCLAFNEIIESDKPKIILLSGGCYNAEIEEKVKANPANEVYIL